MGAVHFDSIAIFHGSGSRYFFQFIRIIHHVDININILFYEFSWKNAGPTVIRPSDVSEIVVNATEDVRIPCDVTTDASERSTLVVEWRKDGVVLKPDGRTIVLDPVNFSLTIKQSKLADTAGYTCHASNGLDTATSDVIRVKVRGQNVYFLYCHNTFDLEYSSRCESTRCDST